MSLKLQTAPHLASLLRSASTATADPIAQAPQTGDFWGEVSNEIDTLFRRTGRAPAKAPNANGPAALRNSILDRLEL
jgi:hypothetical protein